MYMRELCIVIKLIRTAKQALRQTDRKMHRQKEKRGEMKIDR